MPLCNELKKDYIITNDDSIFIGFRGMKTNSEREFAFKTELVPLILHGKFLGNVHKGFLQIFSKKLKNLKKKLLKNNKKVHFIGYSLGGVMAIFSSIYFQFLNPTCLLYGVPKIGDEKFVESFISKIDYVMHSNIFDPIIYFPFNLKYKKIPTSYIYKFNFNPHYLENYCLKKNHETHETIHKAFKER